MPKQRLIVFHISSCAPEKEAPETQFLFLAMTDQSHLLWCRPLELRREIEAWTLECQYKFHFIAAQHNSINISKAHASRLLDPQPFKIVVASASKTGKTFQERTWTCSAQEVMYRAEVEVAKIHSLATQKQGSAVAGVKGEDGFVAPVTRGGNKQKQSENYIHR